MYKDCYWLRVFVAPSGQWAGQVYKGDEIICGIAGCTSQREVEDTAYEQFPDLEEIVLGSLPKEAG